MSVKEKKQARGRGCVWGVFREGLTGGRCLSPPWEAVREQAVGTSGDRRSRQRAELGKGVGQV